MYEFLIPEFTDQEEIEGSENITVSVSSLQNEFMVFDEELMKIKFFGLKNETSGNYTIEITLEDSLGKS